MDLRYILEAKPKGLADELAEDVEEMGDTRMIFTFLVWAAGRMTSGISYWNKENWGGSESQWSGEGPRVPLWTC